MILIQGVGELTGEQRDIVEKTFLEFSMNLEFTAPERLIDVPTISFTKEASSLLTSKNIPFFNWDLLFSVLGPNDMVGDIKGKIRARIEILKLVSEVKICPTQREIHGSIRVKDLAQSSAFYTWLFGVTPCEWTHRYVIFKNSEMNLNFVLLVADGNELHQDTLYHLGIGGPSKQKVIELYHSGVNNGFHIEKPPRTTWRGTPLHELWLKDPDGTLIEIYSRLTDQELAKMPEDKEPILLI
jgi:catechol 2,3-dioxygenase-like lactoylglutathione lyase family enzyme